MAKVKLGVFIKGLLDRTGVKMDETSQEFKDLNNTSVELDDTITNALNEALLTIDAAVAHETVKKRVKAATLDPLDKHILKLAAEAGLEVDDLKAEVNTHLKIAKLVTAIAEAEKKKAGAPPKEKAAYEKDIEKLNNDIKAAKEAFEAEKKGLVTANDGELLDLLLERELGAYEYAPSEFGKDFVVKYAKESALKALTENKGKLVREGRSLKIVNAETNGELFDATNNKVRLKGILDKTVAPLLKKSDPNKPAPVVVETPGGGKKGDSATAGQLTSLASEMSTV